MATEINIDHAIAETLKKHPDFSVVLSSIIYQNIYMGTKPYNFTSSVRSEVATAKQVDFIKYILNEAITIYTTNLPVSKNPTIQKAITILKDKTNNTLFYYLCNRTELFELIEAVFQITFYKGWYEPSELIYDKRQTYHNHFEHISNSNKESGTLRRMLAIETKQFNSIDNLEINYEAVNKCRREVMMGTQVRNRHNEYNVGRMYATQDVGRRRNSQEDSVLILEHMSNPNFKLMAVADGMGGLEKGEIASTYTLNELSAWFNSLPVSCYDNPAFIQMSLSNKIREISKSIYELLGSTPDHIVGGSTLSVSVVTRQETIVESVGDSRVYTQSRNGLNLVTSDESVAWQNMVDRVKRPTLQDVDDLRLVKNNVITRCIGYPELGCIQSLRIPNESYDKLFIFSDGVTDILSSKDINYICSTTPPEQLTDAFIEWALSHGVNIPIRRDDYIEQVEQVVSPGKDNASAVSYIRR